MPATFQKQRKHLRWGPSAAELAPMFHKMVQIQNRSIPSQPSVTDTGCWNDDLIHLLRLSHAVRALEWGAQPVTGSIHGNFGSCRLFLDD